MKFKAGLIALSLLLNLALGFVLVRRLSAHPAPNAADTKSSATSHTAHIAPDNEAWNKLTADDEKAFVSRLRAEGFPLSVIEALVRLQIRAKYLGRLRELTHKDAEIPYWRTNSWSYDFNPETRAERRAIYRKISDEIRQLLGDDFDSLENPYARNSRTRSYGSIPPAKVTAIQEIQRDYSELTSQVRDAMKGITLAEDREKLIYLENERRADLAQLLTPDELAEYDKRNSTSAYSVRAQLRYLDSTEEEFLKLYQLQKTFDDQYGCDNLSGAQTDRRNAADKSLKSQVEVALGPERYAEYQIVNDGNYPNARNFVTNAGLPVDIAKDLVLLQQEVKQRAESVRNNTSLTREQQTNALSALQTEAEANVSSLIGQDNLKSYKRYAGAWLSKLTPSPMASSTR